MGNIIRKTVGMVLIGLVLFFTLLSILAIWGVVEVEQVMTKSLTTMLIIFVASAVILFIFSVVYKQEEQIKQKNE